MLISPPAVGTPSLAIGRILNSLEIFKAAEPKSWSAGSSEATEQSSVPLTDTWQCSVTRPPTFMRDARSG